MQVKWIKQLLNRRQWEEPWALLPWYLNGTLPAADRRAVEDWLRGASEAEAELATWESMQSAVAGQEAQAPSPQVWQRVAGQLQEQPARRPAWILPQLAWGAACALVALVVLWTVFQPGIELSWSVDGGPPSAFRVYRAPAGSADFGLLGELPAGPADQQYTYSDARPWTGRTYVYRLEAVGVEGGVAASRSLTVSDLEALPGQAAILAASLIVGCLAAVLSERWRFRGWGLARLPA